MSTVALNTDFQVEPPLKPVEIFCLKVARQLDTVYYSKRTKKPCWATITAGPVTTLYSVTDWGALLARAVITWASEIDSGTNTKKSPFEPTVTIDGQVHPVEKFGRNSTGSRHDKSIFTFQMNDLNCQWKAETEPMFDKVQYLHELQEMPHWNCTTDILNGSPASPPPPDEPTTSSATPSRFRSLFKSSPKPKEQKEPRTLLAIYQPPYIGLRSEMALSIYPEGVPHAFQLLLSAILILSKKDEWKRSQSKRDALELEEIIKEDLGQRLPGYTSRLTLHDTVTATRPSRW